MRKKFGLAPQAVIHRLLLQTGELIDQIALIERNDRILVELKIQPANMIMGGEIDADSQSDTHAAAVKVNERNRRAIT